jgi:hypothetical protein
MELGGSALQREKLHALTHGNGDRFGANFGQASWIVG